MKQDINALLEQNPNLTDEELLTKLSTEFTTTNERMISQDMVTTFLIQNTSLKTLHSATSELAFGFWTAITSGVKEFNLMNSHPVGQAQQAMLGALVSEGAVTQGFMDQCISYCNAQVPKYSGITLQQVKEARYPTTWKPVTITSGNSQIVTPEGGLISSANNGAFRFSITSKEEFTGPIKIRIYAKKADDTAFALQESYPIVINKSWESNTTYASVFKRVVGLSAYRHFKFEYLAPFEAAVEGVTVEGVN
jgi:hypothetical protein